MPTQDAAARAANDIIENMRSRSGGDHWWDGIDDAIQEEIRAEWAELIRQRVERAGAERGRYHGA
jgi:GTP-dependent phosphoenolpyruvate carboxykinase